MRSRLILPLVILEVIAQVYLVQQWAALSAIICLAVGLIIGYLMIMEPTDEYIHTAENTTTLWRNIIVLTGLLMLGSYAKDLFETFPLDYRVADMLPIMKIMTERFISGADPYAIIPEIWGGMQPIYLPALWLPNLPAIALDFDMRWIGVAGLGISAVLIYDNLNLSKQSISPRSLIPFILLLVMMISVDPSMITKTQESIIVLWYVCMIWSLIEGRSYLFGLFSALSLLSRYAIAPWLLMIGGLLIITKRIDFLKRSMLTGVITLVVLLVISGAYQHTPVFLGLSDNYLAAIQSNQVKYESLIHNGLGIAKFFRYDQLHLLHGLMQCVALITPLVLGVFYYLKRGQMEFKNFALGSLKICLVLFYSLIIMPYSYLFYPSIFLSLMIVTRIKSIAQ